MDEDNKSNEDEGSGGSGGSDKALDEVAEAVDEMVSFLADEIFKPNTLYENAKGASEAYEEVVRTVMAHAEPPAVVGFGPITLTGDMTIATTAEEAKHRGLGLMLGFAGQREKIAMVPVALSLVTALDLANSLLGSMPPDIGAAAARAFAGIATDEDAGILGHLFSEQGPGMETFAVNTGSAPWGMGPAYASDEANSPADPDVRSAFEDLVRDFGDKNEGDNDAEA